MEGWGQSNEFQKEYHEIFWDFLKQSKPLHVFLMKTGGKTSSCQSFLNFNTSQKDIKRNIYSGLASCWHLCARQLGTHWCLCLRGCRRPFHLCHSPGWTYALTFLPIIKKRETWLFNQTKPTTVIPCSVLAGWLGDSIPSRRIRFWKRKTNTPFLKIENRNLKRENKWTIGPDTDFWREEKVIETNSAETPKTEGNGLKRQPTELIKWCYTII